MLGAQAIRGGVMGFLFSFQGRINRAKIWLFFLIVVCVWIVMLTLFATLVGFSAFTAQAHNGNGLLAAGGGLMILGVVSLVVYIALLVAAFAVTTKRLHDRDKSGVWIIPFLILPIVLNCYVVYTILTKYGLQHIMEANADPILAVCRLGAFVFGIWGFVELYCLRGTVGDNRYGPDPLAGRV
jgi:uncharacterized membrane protein YhaH (DUF805 family)